MFIFLDRDVIMKLTCGSQLVKVCNFLRYVYYTNAIQMFVKLLFDALLKK